MKYSDDQLLEFEKKWCSYGDTVHYNDPVHIFESCSESYLKDYQGNNYLDFQMAYSAANFGYANPTLESTLIKQARQLPMVASEYLSEKKILLSKLIGESIEEKWKKKGRVHFNVGGAQSIDDSLKLVSANCGHRNVFAFEGSYHGRTLGASAITSSFRYRKKFGSFGSRAYFVPYPYCFRCPAGANKSNCSMECLNLFKRLFETEYASVLDVRNNDPEYVAFYIEPVQGTGGYIIPPFDYYKELSKILKKYNILLVADEIQMGFYRTGKLWSMEHFGVAPDILVFGKSMTNGMNPLAGLWAKEDLITPEKFPPGSTHSTFGSNPLGAALGCEVFNIIDQNDYETSVSRLGEYLLEGLQDLSSRHAEIGDVDGLGLAARIEICHADGKTPNKFLTDTIKQLGMTRSIETDFGAMRLVLDVGGYYKNVFTLAPSLNITFEEIDTFLVLFEAYLVMAKGQA